MYKRYMTSGGRYCNLQSVGRRCVRSVEVGGTAGCRRRGVTYARSVWKDVSNVEGDEGGM